MTIAITVRDVPDEVVDELTSRAARSGTSLEEHVRGMLVAAASRPSVDDLIARARSRVEAGGVRLDADAILTARDADRRRAGRSSVMPSTSRSPSSCGPTW